MGSNGAGSSRRSVACPSSAALRRQACCWPFGTRRPAIRPRASSLSARSSSSPSSNSHKLPPMAPVVSTMACRNCRSNAAAGGADIASSTSLRDTARKLTSSSANVALDDTQRIRPQALPPPRLCGRRLPRGAAHLDLPELHHVRPGRVDCSVPSAFEKMGHVLCDYDTLSGPLAHLHGRHVQRISSLNREQRDLVGLSPVLRAIPVRPVPALRFHFRFSGILSQT